jgi:hypothetical protein
MALPFEALTAEARRAERDARFRAREQWGQEDEQKRMLLRTGTQLEAIRVRLEDTLTEPQGEGEAVRLRAGIRDALRGTYELYKQIGVGAKYGMENIQRICDPVVDAEGLTEEEERRVKEMIKEQGGGKMRQERSRGAEKPYVEERREPAAAVEVAAAYGLGYAGVMGWPGVQLQQLTQLQPMPQQQPQMPILQQGGMMQPMVMPYGVGAPPQYSYQFGAEGWTPTAAGGAASGSGAGQMQSRAEKQARRI